MIGAFDDLLLARQQLDNPTGSTPAISCRGTDRCNSLPAGVIAGGLTTHRPVATRVYARVGVAVQEPRTTWRSPAVPAAIQKNVPAEHSLSTVGVRSLSSGTLISLAHQLTHPLESHSLEADEPASISLGEMLGYVSV